MEQTESEYAHKPNILQHQCIHIENHGHETQIEYCTNCLLNWNFYFMPWYEFVLLLNAFAYARIRAIFEQSYVDRTKRFFSSRWDRETESFVHRLKKKENISIRLVLWNDAVA